MARIVDMPQLPPSGGSAREEELAMRAQGWTVDNGKVTIPGRDIKQDSTISAIASTLGREGVHWLSQTTDALASSYVAREHAEWHGQWNKYQMDMQKMTAAAGQSGDYYQLPDQMMQSYNAFKERYKEQRGDAAYKIVAPLFDKHEKYVLSEIMITETQVAKATAAKYLNTIRNDQLLKLRDNPSSLPIVLKSMDPKIFQVGNMSPDDAAKEYGQTVDLFIKEALAAESVANPSGAMATLDAVSMYMQASTYSKYKKQISAAERQLQRAQSSQLSRVEQAQRVLDVAQSENIVPITAELKRNADVLENIWGTEFNPADSVKKDDVYIKIGYVPPLYSNRLYNSMLHSTDESERGSAAKSLMYLSNNLPPWSTDLPKDAVELAFAYNEISEMGNTASAEELFKRFSKYTEMSASDRKSINDLTMNHIRARNGKDRNSFEEARAQIFTEPGLLWGTNPMSQDALTGSLTAIEQIKFDKEIVDSMKSYMVLGFPPDVAEKRAIARAKTSWGTSNGIGGDPYPTYVPIERAVGATDARKVKAMQGFITKVLQEFPRPNKAAFPNKNDIRIIHDSGEGNEAMYNVLYFDHTYEQWLPYMVVQNGEDVALSISTAALTKKLYGE